MNRIIRKAIWSWQDWRIRCKLPELRQRRRRIIKRQKQHGKVSPLIQKQRDDMLELLRS